MSIAPKPAPEPAYRAMWAYNARSTRPRAHHWPATDHAYRKAACGAWAHDDLLDENPGATIPRCPRCMAKLLRGLKNVSAFVGELVHKETRKPAMCEACGVARGTWMHETRDGRRVLLCFGCGDH
jgi:hypothetical protein